MAEIANGYAKPDTVASAGSTVMAADSTEWPEFRQWYDPMLEEEALFSPGNAVGETDTDDDNRQAVVANQMRALLAKMQTLPYDVARTGGGLGDNRILFGREANRMRGRDRPLSLFKAWHQLPDG